LADIVERLVIDPHKLSDYALDPASPYGKHKAVLFEKLLGFTQDNYADLIRQLEQRCLHAEATFHSEDDFGERYTVDVLIDGATGQQATVRAGWIVLTDEPGTAHLVTLYVKKR
jgi:hypothetical protein